MEFGREMLRSALTGFWAVLAAVLSVLFPALALSFLPVPAPAGRAPAPHREKRTYTDIVLFTRKRE